MVLSPAGVLWYQCMPEFSVKVGGNGLFFQFYAVGLRLAGMFLLPSFPLFSRFIKQFLLRES